MRAHEIMENASGGSTGSGSVATVSQPLGMQTKFFLHFLKRTFLQLLL